MMLGFVGATATMVLGSIVAYISVRTTWRGRRLIDAIAWLPWMMPGIVLAIGFLWGFAMLPAQIPIYGTVWALFLAYLALGTPVSVRVMSGAYAQLSFDLEECSRVHGATFFQTLTRILVALAWPAFAVGWVLAFFGIMRELSASIMLYSTGSEVLSVVLVKRWVNGLAEAGQRDRPDDDGAGDRLPLGAAGGDQAADQHAVRRTDKEQREEQMLGKFCRTAVIAAARDCAMSIGAARAADHGVAGRRGRRGEEGGQGRLLHLVPRRESAPGHHQDL